MGARGQGVGKTRESGDTAGVGVEYVPQRIAQEVKGHTHQRHAPQQQEDRRLGWGTALLLLLLIAALLSTLIWPVWWRWLANSHVPPTPTPLFLKEI